jgi:hypothetical protein
MGCRLDDLRTRRRIHPQKEPAPEFDKPFPAIGSPQGPLITCRAQIRRRSGQPAALVAWYVSQ